MSTPSLPIRLAGVLYSRDTEDRGLLARFAAGLTKRGWQVGGLVQQELYNQDNSKCGVDAVAIDTGERIPLNRPTRMSRETNVCTLDSFALTESSAALRRAIARRDDLLIVEKFGEQERKGQGLADDILAAVTAGIPTLVSVPTSAIDEWHAFTGGLGVLLPNDQAALWRWWGTETLYHDLASDVDDAPAGRVIMGLNWTLVEGPHGAGVAMTPLKSAPGCHDIKRHGAFSGQPLSQLAKLAGSWNPFEAAIGIAACNAHHNHRQLEGSNINGLDAFSDLDGQVAIIGDFPGARQRLKNPVVVETHPTEDEAPAVLGPQIVATSEAAVITASTLVNRTLPGLLGAAAQTRIAVVGPGTPLCPYLFNHGIEILSGLVIEDSEAAVRAIAEGGAGGALKNCGRQVTLTTTSEDRL